MYWLISIAFVLGVEQTGSPAPTVTWISPELTGQALVALSGSGPHVWAVGDGGTILRSDDGGVNWVSVESGTKADLHAVWASGAKEAWVAGGEGTVLRSRDGGIRWEKVDTQGVADLWSVWGSSTGDVYVAGSGGNILRMKDGDPSFQLHRPLGATTETFTNVQGSSANEVYAGGDQGSLLVSRDDGAHWTARLRQTPARASASRLPRPASGCQIHSLVAAEPGHVLAMTMDWLRTRKGSATTAVLRYSVSGGTSWKNSVVRPAESLRSVYGPFTGAGPSTVFGLVTFDIEQPVKSYRQGLVVSPDAGAAFERRYLFDKPTLNGLWHGPEATLIGVGAMGTIVRSTDDGFSWAESSKHPFGEDDLNAIAATLGNDVWVVGDKGRVLHSAAGSGWFDDLKSRVGGPDTALRSVWGSKKGDVYVGGPAVYHSDDGGKTFTVVTPPAHTSKVGWKVWGRAPDDVYAFDCGVWRTTDHAHSWQTVYGGPSQSECPAIHDVFGSSRGDIYLRTPKALLHASTPGGALESHPLPDDVRLLWASEDAEIFAFLWQNRFLRSSDHGRTWQRVPSPLPEHASPLGVALRSKAVYLLAGGTHRSDNRTLLLHSVDQGTTWDILAVLPWGCRALALAENGDVWIAGQRGLLARVH